MLRIVNAAKATEGQLGRINAKPTHSNISPKKFAPDTYSKKPPSRKRKVKAEGLT